MKLPLLLHQGLSRQSLPRPGYHSCAPFPAGADSQPARLAGGHPKDQAGAPRARCAAGARGRRGVQAAAAQARARGGGRHGAAGAVLLCGLQWAAVAPRRRARRRHGSCKPGAAWKRAGRTVCVRLCFPTRYVQASVRACGKIHKQVGGCPKGVRRPCSDDSSPMASLLRGDAGVQHARLTPWC